MSTPLIRDVRFDEETRAGIVLTGSARIDPTRGVLELRRDASGNFPTTGEHFAISASFHPGAVRAWYGFQVFVRQAYSGLQPLTSVLFRLHNGTDQFAWNGSSWMASTSVWNTEQEVSDFIDQFPITTKTIRVVVRLVTTDKSKTPTVELIKIGWLAKIDFFEDMIYRSLTSMLREFRYEPRIVFRVAFPGGLTLPVAPAVVASGIPYLVRDVVAIYNESLDPEHMNDLLDTWDGLSGNATLTTAIPVGSFAYVEISVEPEIAISATSQDYVEVEKVPSLLITNIESVNSQPLSQDDGVVNKATGVATRVHAPYRFDIRFDMIAAAPSGIDLVRMTESLVDFMAQHQLIRSVGLDQMYRIWMLNEVDVQTSPNLADVHQSSASFVIKDISKFRRSSSVGGEVAVRSLHVGGDLDIEILPREN